MWTNAVIRPTHIWTGDKLTMWQVDLWTQLETDRGLMRICTSFRTFLRWYPKRCILDWLYTDCVDAVADWMRSNRLQLNSDKMEFMWCATVRRQHSLPTVGPLIKSSTVTPSSAVRDLGVYIDSGLTMQSHVRQTVSRCFAVLLQLRTVCRQVPPSVFQSLIVALSLSRLDYCNSVLFGLPANLIQRLQSVQNAAARLTFRIRRSEHITPALISLHWLRVPERISFKLVVLTYRSIHGTSPFYLQSCFTRVSDITSRRRLRFSTSHRLDVPPVRLYTVGRWAFPVSGATVWNDVPLHVASAPLLAVFRQRIKTFLFSRSYTKTLSYD